MSKDWFMLMTGPKKVMTGLIWRHKQDSCDLSVSTQGRKKQCKEWKQNWSFNTSDGCYSPLLNNGEGVRPEGKLKSPAINARRMGTMLMNVMKTRQQQQQQHLVKSHYLRIRLPKQLYLWMEYPMVNSTATWTSNSLAKQLRWWMMRS